MITRRALLAGLAAAPLFGREAVMASASSPAIFVAAHPDDEILAMGVTLAEHLSLAQDVHVLLLTDGTASGVINMLNATGAPSTWWGVAHNPAAEGYTPLTPADLGVARVAEAESSIRCLAAGQPGTLTIHRAGLPDGAVTQAAAAAAITALADLVAPGAPVRVKTHTHLVDNHPDHLAAGLAARQLAAADPRFADLRHYIEQPYWSDARLSQVTTSWDTPASSDISTRVRNACRAYASWHPPASYAVGYHSVASQFDSIAATPKCLVHP